jgi:hypothetical protein
MIDLKLFPHIRIHPSERVDKIICSNQSESGGKFVVLQTTGGDYVAAWDGRYATYRDMDDLRGNLNRFEKELLDKGLNDEQAEKDRSRSGDHF